MVEHAQLFPSWGPIIEQTADNPETVRSSERDVASLLSVSWPMNANRDALGKH